MRYLPLLTVLILTLGSCGKRIYGIYNTNHSMDKSVFYQINLNIDNTVEKTETHTINDYAKGRFVRTTNMQVICFLDSSSSKFPPDTLLFKIKGKKLYFIKNGVLNNKAYLLKQ